MATYKEFPHCHAFAAGHAAENSIPHDAFHRLRNCEVLQTEINLWNRTETVLAALKLDIPGSKISERQAALFQLGYIQAMGTDEIADAADDAERAKLEKEHDQELGLDDPIIKEFVDSLY
jgi:hypothetical protein